MLWLGASYSITTTGMLRRVIPTTTGMLRRRVIPTTTGMLRIGRLRPRRPRLRPVVDCDAIAWAPALALSSIPSSSIPASSASANSCVSSTASTTSAKCCGVSSTASTTAVTSSREWSPDSGRVGFRGMLISVELLDVGVATAVAAKLTS